MPTQRGRPKGSIKAESQRIYAELTKLQAEYGEETVTRLRKSIQGQVIIKRFMDHIRGEIELAPTQVQAGIALLQRVLPALQSVEVSAVDVERVTVIRAPERAKSADDWQKLIEHKANGSNGHSES
jgi:hypothetical protein